MDPTEMALLTTFVLIILMMLPFTSMISSPFSNLTFGSFLALGDGCLRTVDSPLGAEALPFVREPDKYIAKTVRELQSETIEPIVPYSDPALTESPALMLRLIRLLHVGIPRAATYCSVLLWPLQRTLQRG